MTNCVLWDEPEEGIVQLTLNKPDRRNSLSGPDMIDALTGAIERLRQTSEVGAVILTGAGSAFSSGGDLLSMQERAEERRSRPAATPQHYEAGIQRLPLAFQTLDVPIIAAINGPAVGAGLDLACMCDIRLAAEGATMAASFVKLGLVSGDGGAWFMPRVIGHSRACELLFTGRTVTAEEALEYGLVSRVVPEPDLLPQARRLAVEIAQNPRDGVRMTKRLIREGAAASLGQSLSLAAAFQALAHTTEDHRTAVTKLAERRRR